MTRSSSVTVGTRFARAGQQNKAYVVAELPTMPGFPTHARLVQEGGDEVLLIAVAALRDRNLYVRLPA